MTSTATWGAQREKFNQCVLEKENVIVELATLRTIGVSAPEKSDMSVNPLSPPFQFVNIDDDCVMVVSPSGESYAAAAAKPMAPSSKRKKGKKRDDFPVLKMPVAPNRNVQERLGKKEPTINNATDIKGSRDKKSLIKARQVTAESRF